MDAISRIEQTLSAALSGARAPGAPKLLAEAMHHAVFPKGARLRPRLCIAVAGACGTHRPELAAAAGVAIELMHCASLVHDDLPCFDDADTRRGRPSVHKAFGEPLAVLAGDALIVLAFETLTRAGERVPSRLGVLTRLLCGAVGVPSGIVAGQAYECEERAELSTYQRAKTGALFSAATMMGAASAGADPEPWRILGDKLGEAYQVADDIRDLVADPDELGKPVGRDAALGRPSVALSLGIDGAIERLGDLAAGAMASVPDCPKRSDLSALIALETKRLLPKDLARSAA